MTSERRLTVRYDVQGAGNSGGDRHPLVVMEELAGVWGFNILKAQWYPIGDCWIFEIELEGTVIIFPDYVIAVGEGTP